jgi:hypothetical protein
MYYFALEQPGDNKARVLAQGDAQIAEASIFAQIRVTSLWI